MMRVPKQTSLKEEGKVLEALISLMMKKKEANWFV